MINDTKDITVFLKEVAYARSGDKGIHSNVGVCFKTKDIYNWAKSYLTESLIKNYYKSIVKGDVLRYELDNIYALNFILQDSLGGGGSETLQNDAQGKTYAQLLLMMKVNIPMDIYESK